MVKNCPTASNGFKLALISKGLRRFYTGVGGVVGGFKLALISKGLRPFTKSLVFKGNSVSSLP